jgi:hypothetical protein
VTIHMLMVKKEIKQHVEEMRNMANVLIPFTFPQVDFEEEQEVLLLKQRNIIFDGYDITICYSKANYDKYFLESLQIQSYYTPFLPFVLVCKLGRIFLGENNLAYVEFFRNGRKVYCWTIRSKNGQSLPPENKTKPGIYQGFKFNILQNDSIELF